MKTLDNFKLGLFVAVSILGLATLFYSVRKKNLFWASYIELKARFRNVSGLQKGNNVRYGGMHVGTVKDIYLFNDTTIEIVMEVDASMQRHIRTDTKASISSDGFVGDKVVNLATSNSLNPTVKDGDLISAKESLDPGQMMELMSESGSGVKTIMGNANGILRKIDQSQAIWRISSDEEYPAKIKAITDNLDFSAKQMRFLTAKMNRVLEEVKDGDGLVPTMLSDGSYVDRVDTIYLRTSAFIAEANQVLGKLNDAVDAIDRDLQHGNGAANKILKDSTFSSRLDSSLIGIGKATRSFVEVMDALKGSFIFRKRFRKEGKSE